MLLLSNFAQALTVQDVLNGQGKGTVLGTSTPAFVQSATASFDNASNISSVTTNAITTTSGNLLVAAVTWDNGSNATASMSDSKGNTWVAATTKQTDARHGQNMQSFYAKNISGGASHTVTATFSAGTVWVRLIVHEVSGLDISAPLDQTAVNNGLTGAAISVGPLTTTAVGEYIFAAAMDDGGNNAFAAVNGSGFTERATAAQGDAEMQSQDTIQSSAGSISSPWAMSGTDAALAQMVTFKPATSGAPDTTPPTTPTNLTATAVSSSAINLSWTASTDPDNAASQLSYKVFRNGVQVGTAAAGANTYQDSGLSASTPYTYTVSAYDAAGNNSSQSTSASATTQAAASTGTATEQNANYSEDSGSANSTSVTANIHAVGDLVVITAWCHSLSGSCTPTSVTLGNQTAVQTSVSGIPSPGAQDTGQYSGTGQGWIYYILSSSASGNQTLTFIATGTHTDIQTSYMDFTPSAGFTFTHHIDYPLGTSLDPNTGLDNGHATALINAPVFTPTAGDLLFDFLYTTEHIGVIGSPWSCVIYPGITGANNTCNFDSTVNSQAYVLSATANSTNPNTTINAVDNWQALVTSFTLSSGGSDATPPTTPANLTATAVSSSGINLSWAASTDPDNTASQLTYKVFRNGVQVGITAAGATTYQDSGLTANTTYFYTVSAADPAGNSSSQSISASATTQAADTPPYHPHQPHCHGCIIIGH